MDIKDRIIEFLKKENISSATFALEIGVQPSGISHIISGRNKPSLDFIIKMINRYPFLSTDWLLFGKGQMMTENIPAALFREEMKKDDLFSGQGNDLFDVSGTVRAARSAETGSEDAKNLTQRTEPPENDRKAARIVIFNSDGTFTEYFPG